MKRSYISKSTAYLKALEQKEVNIPKRSTRQEINKLRDDINQLETWNTTQKLGDRSLRILTR